MREAAFHQAIADLTRDSPHPRFAVYRNNVTSALINALRVRYPVTAKLMGAVAFSAGTREFTAAYRPQSPVLIDYGDNYPEFIASRANVPYLADVARLENLWWRAYHATDAESLAAECFAMSPENIERARFIFHPSAAILNSRWAVGAIWQATRENADLSKIKIGRPETVLVWRPHADVRVNVVDAASGDFLTALMEGKRLVDAIAIESDLQGQFQMLIASQLVTAIETTDRL